jgi:hypothetical protein
MNPVTFDDQLTQQIAQAEARERDARAAELRLQSMGLPAGSIKPRSYGELPKVVGLTARALVARQDPALAMLLGMPVPRPSYEADAAAEARQQEIQRMQQATAATRAANQQAQRQRYQQQLAGVDGWGRPRWAR